jgi:glycosyltransferase involved in cell wall biosynthesis
MSRGWDVTVLSTEGTHDIVLDGVRHLGLGVSMETAACARHIEDTVARLGHPIIYQRIALPLTVHAAEAAKSLGVPFVFGPARAAECLTYPFARIALRAPGWRAKVYATRRSLKWDRRITRAVGTADAIVVQSSQHAGLIRDSYGLSATAVGQICPLASEAEGSHRQMILWVGNIKSWKRPELFLELARRCSDTDLEFVVVGAGDVGQTIPANVRLLGALDHAATMTLLRDSLFLVHTAQPEIEGFANVLLEAWSNGKPTLTLGVDPDGVINRYGLGVVCSSMDDLEEQTRRFLRDLSLRGNAGRAAREYIRRSHAVDVVVDRMETVLEPLVHTNQ